MTRPATDHPGARRPDRVTRLLAAAAFLISMIGLVFAMTGMAASHSKSHGVVRLNAKGKVPLAVLPTVPSAKNSKALGGASRQKLSAACPISGAIDMGTWCLEGSTYKIPTADIGKNNYIYATQKCVEEGGWLPTAAQLIGAAPKVALKSTLDDDPGTSATTEFPEARNGIKDEREMTADLFTTTAGAAAAGSEGVTEGARGATTTGEPDPLPAPADPLPSSLDYVTVFDNHNVGGFAGGQPVSEPQNFRCAYAKGYQGKPRDTSSRS